MTSSLYERIGGDTAIMAAVDLFYQKVVADNVTRPFFGEVDMGAQTKKMVAFMNIAFGGPAEYNGRNMRDAHADLVKDGLNDEHFDAVAVHLDSTLRELNVPDQEINEVMEIVGGTREEVLNK